MSSQASNKLYIQQNKPDFKLDPLDKQLLIFRFKYFSKTLEPLKENPNKDDDFRLVTIKCLFFGCK